MSPNAIDPRVTAPYRLYFWSNENIDTHKQPHVHVESGDGYAEFWLGPVQVKNPGSYKTSSGLGPGAPSSDMRQGALKPGGGSMAAVEHIALADPR